MEEQAKLSYSLLVLCFFHILVVGDGRNASYGHQHTIVTKKLFVFGDSYADTGNWNKDACSWKEPYGLSFPGKPAGRFSDGRVLTDYIASFLGIEPPVPFTRRKTANKSSFQSGMNFAFGGTGVFDTFVDAPNMTVQIDFFQQLLEEKAYNKQDLNSSIALISVAGNDYPAYVDRVGNLKDLPSFTKSLVKQLSINLKRIHQLGVRKIVVTSLQPIGCLPKLTISSSYQNCSESWNAASEFHNQVLDKMIHVLNMNHSNFKEQVFQVLDMYSAFVTGLNKAVRQGNSKLEDPLKPCCVGVTSKDSCGDKDASGVNKYVVCAKPESSIFWDIVHPSQNGWQTVYSTIESSLYQLINISQKF